MYKKAICFLVPFLFLLSCSNKKVPQIPPPEVQVIETVLDTVPLMEDFLGQTYGYYDIYIRARVDGVLEGMYFREGFPVKKGQLLYKIDPQPFEAEVAQAMSELAEAQTSLAKAESDLNRIKPLAEINAVSKSELDGAVARYGAAKASVEAAQAGLRLTKIKLGYTDLYAPIDGIIGRSQAKVGDYVGKEPNPVVLNAVSRIDTILVRFSITEKDYIRLARHWRQDVGKSSLDKKKKNRPGLTLILADGSVHDYKGKVDFIDRNVDPTTGSLLVQASFPNPNKYIRPGQYARVRGILDIAEGVILIPQRCVMEFQGNHSVYVVDEEGKVSSRDIKVGPTIESFWLVIDGLKPTEKLIYEGLQKVKEGLKVNPVLIQVDLPKFD